MTGKSILLVFLTIMFLQAKGFSKDEKFYIFICFGQSNMEGNAPFESRDTVGIDKRFLSLSGVDCPDLKRVKGNWYKALPPLCRCTTGLTPADYFGRTMIDNLPKDVRIGIINVSVGGCKIELFDKNNYQSYVAAAPGWMTGTLKQYDGNPYGRIIELAKLAQKDGVIKGILLHQGESNTNDTLWPKKVADVYGNLINDLHLNASSVPLLAGEVVNEDQGGVCAGMNKIIATLPQVIPSAYVISSAGCTAAADKLHFNASGYREFGKRYAEKMLQLLEDEPKKSHNR